MHYDEVSNSLTPTDAVCYNLCAQCLCIYLVCLPTHTIQGRDPIWIEEEQMSVHEELLRRRSVQLLTVLKKPYYYCFTSFIYLCTQF